MRGPVRKEDSIAGVDEVCGIVQSDLVVSVVLTVSMFMAEPPVLKGMSVCVVLLSAWDKLWNM